MMGAVSRRHLRLHYPRIINFNPNANTLETENSCDFTLTLTDGAGDGWFGNWIGVVQGDEIFGPFTMHPPDGFERYNSRSTQGSYQRLVLHTGNAELPQHNVASTSTGLTAHS